jgi:hypothetical protein
MTDKNRLRGLFLSKQKESFMETNNSEECRKRREEQPITYTNT